MNRMQFEAWLQDPERRTLLMGVLNVTPDSFSDGGRYLEPEKALERARAMVSAGASLIDVGGESTRPGSEPVPEAEQIRRVTPVVEALRDLEALISVDTTRAAVAEAALDAGACLVNDISAGRDDPAMLPLVARRSAPIVLMHMRGTPRTMQQAPRYRDVVGEVATFLLDRAGAALDHHVAEHRILLDVGIGFGKSLEHNLALLRSYRTFASLGYATVLGTSRKGFIGRLTGQPEPERRLLGTAATVCWGIAHGASLLRVHDVAEMAEVRAVTEAILTGGPTEAAGSEGS